MARKNSDFGYTLNDLKRIMSSLRDPVNGCEWDKNQDSNSIKKYCIEEAYEVVDAIERNDNEALCEELGDLLFQVIFHAQINSEKENFNLEDIINSISKKMIRRHPHVFDERFKTKSIEKIEKNWTKVKNIERKKKGIKSLLDDIPLSFPAMIRSLKLQKRASENGFDWENLGDVLKKINEEKEELEIAINNKNREEIEEELGDLIFSIINLARKFSIDPENSLRKTNTKFQKRIKYIEQKLERENKKFNETDLKKLEKLWNEAKNN